MDLNDDLMVDSQSPSFCLRAIFLHILEITGLRLIGLSALNLSLCDMCSFLSEEVERYLWLFLLL